MSNCTNIFIFPMKLLKNGFVANDKCRRAPGFDLIFCYFGVFKNILPKIMNFDPQSLFHIFKVKYLKIMYLNIMTFISHFFSGKTF